jgi:anti-sigma factor ChrR (cupin superfamily)
MASVIAAAAMLSASPAQADINRNSAIQITPMELIWKDNPRLPPGVQTATVWGDPSKEGLFVFRVKWPPNVKVQPHSHPSDEYVTVISGTWMTASGDIYEDAKLQALPPGGFYMLPARVNQFSTSGDEETVIEVTAMGPWGVHFDPARDHK